MSIAGSGGQITDGQRIGSPGAHGTGEIRVEGQFAFRCREFTARRLMPQVETGPACRCSACLDLRHGSDPHFLTVSSDKAPRFGTGARRLFVMILRRSGLGLTVSAQHMARTNKRDG
ncbi:hypothetical protein [Citreicella sp. C3M06]|uniref:hypothetical protein n=1 Tax=Citreicella sp. C3M06 TaxID=2841564 RepID=UPI002091117F|nr:hypothetical protein [Citreicella sp. C3M06]